MKKITLINGFSDASYQGFEAHLTQALDARKKDLSYTHFLLRDLSINPCTGCWSCWLKTPGLCAIRDDMDRLLRSAMQSDFVLFVSPVSMDFVTGLCKICCDRMIPLVHPYIGIFDGEFHHKSRYERYPDLGLLLLDETKDDQRFDIIRNVFSRFSINLKTRLSAADMIGSGKQEVCDVVSTY